ncbi:MAG: hypothetical protein A2W27_04565 [Deltaproteobacteria bacterium RBG_16_44_11]|nr:MAG: hypothetical protein A2W27_04565 [Deltaproteobacteria bacterium RBG_16_44_11]
MGSVLLGLNQQIKWPNYCVLCNKETTDWSAASKTNLSNFQYYVVVVQYTTQTYSLTFPVCTKHKRLCDLLYKPFDFISLLGSLVIGLILWAIFFALFHLIFRLLGLETVAKDLIDTLPIVLAVGLVLFYYVYAIFLHPVQISNWSENSIKISIRNKKYFNDFKLLNMDNITE